MTKDALKEKIKKKFGTISNFSRVAGLDRYRLQIVFNKNTKPTKEELEAIHQACKDNKAKETGDLIDPGKLEQLKARMTEYGGVYKFCKDYPNYQYDPIYKLISGKKKRNSDLVKRLFDHFEIQ